MSKKTVEFAYTQIQVDQKGLYYTTGDGQFIHTILLCPMRVVSMFRCLRSVWVFPNIQEGKRKKKVKPFVDEETGQSKASSWSVPLGIFCNNAIFAQQLAPNTQEVLLFHWCQTDCFLSLSYSSCLSSSAPYCSTCHLVSVWDVPNPWMFALCSVSVCEQEHWTLVAVSWCQMWIMVSFSWSHSARSFLPVFPSGREPGRQEYG